MFSPTTYVDVPSTDLLTFVFGGPDYDQDRDIYIDALDDRRRLTANQAKCHIQKLICGLKAHGVRPGDSVLIHSLGDIMYPILYLAIVGAGACFVGSNPSNTSQELSHLLSLTSTRFIITPSQQLPTLLVAIQSLSIPIPTSNIFIFNTPADPSHVPGFQSWESLLLHGSTPWETFTEKETSKETTASLFSTSGTTGLPKIAAVSHHASIARCLASHDPTSKSYNVTRLLALPMFHGVAATAAHIEPLRYGIPTYIMPRFSLVQFLEKIEKYRITETSMIPAILSIILRGSEDAREKLRSLRSVRVAGAPLDVGVQRDFQKWLDTEAKIVRAWGLTEFGTATGFVGGEMDEEGSCGRLLANVEARIIGPDGQEILEDNIAGDVFLRGPSMMDSYLGNETATKEAFVDGWLKTGDIACIKEGKWHIVGRSKDMIKVRGWQVSPAELEACLMQHPQVAEAAVIGIKSNTEESELPRAYVVLKKSSERALEEVSTTEEELKEFCRSRLASYKAMNGGVVFMESLPRTATGKVLKYLLRESS